MTMFQNLRRMMGAGATLKIACETAACGHSAALTRAEAFRRFGGDATPQAVRSRLICSACGAHTPRVWI